MRILDLSFQGLPHILFEKPSFLRSFASARCFLGTSLFTIVTVSTGASARFGYLLVPKIISLRKATFSLRLATTFAISSWILPLNRASDIPPTFSISWNIFQVSITI
jgi:hypothetical protein